MTRRTFISSILVVKNRHRIFPGAYVEHGASRDRTEELGYETEEEDNKRERTRHLGELQAHCDCRWGRCKGGSGGRLPIVSANCDRERDDRVRVISTVFFEPPIFINKEVVQRATAARGSHGEITATLNV